MYCSVVLGSLQKCAVITHYLILQHFHHPKMKPCVHSLVVIPQTHLPAFSGNHSILEFHISGILQHMVFCNWLLSLGIVFSRFMPVVARVCLSHHSHPHGCEVVSAAVTCWSLYVFSFLLPPTPVIFHEGRSGFSVRSLQTYYSAWQTFDIQ